MRRMLRAAAAVLVLVSLATLFIAHRAQTVPLFAARTGLQCQNCHFDPNGGGPRNEFGFAYGKNRHALEPEGETSPWKDLTLTNRIGENFPLYVSVNHRFMLLGGSSTKGDSLDRLAFFNMENGLHLAFQPHPRLTMVYTRDGLNDRSTTREAFGMISGFPLNGYLKAGRIISPFGPRMDDHTVATKIGYVNNLPGGGTFLPFDVRVPDMGLEVGAETAGIFGRLAVTNGGASPIGLAGPDAYADVVTAKLGFNSAWYQGGISFMDDFQHVPGDPAFAGSSAPHRSTRWGYYGLTHYGPVTVLGEIAAGTDAERTLEFDDTPMIVHRTNLLAGFLEANYTPVRWLNGRVRMDHLVLDRDETLDPGSNLTYRELSTHNRWALEADWLPVPFAELRGTYRRIDHRDPLLDDENQFYAQFHFSY